MFLILQAAAYPRHIPRSSWICSPPSQSSALLNKANGDPDVLAPTTKTSTPQKYEFITRKLCKVKVLAVIAEILYIGMFTAIFLFFRWGYIMITYVIRRGCDDD